MKSISVPQASCIKKSWFRIGTSLLIFVPFLGHQIMAQESNRLNSCEKLLWAEKRKANVTESNYKSAQIQTAFGEFQIFGSSHRLQLRFRKVSNDLSVENAFFNLLSSMGDSTVVKYRDGKIEITTHFTSEPRGLALLSHDISELESLIDQVTELMNQRPRFSSKQIDSYHDRSFEDLADFRFSQAFDSSLDVLKTHLSPVLKTVLTDLQILRPSEQFENSPRMMLAQLAYGLDPEDAIQLYKDIQILWHDLIRSFADGSFSLSDFRSRLLNLEPKIDLTIEDTAGKNYRSLPPSSIVAEIDPIAMVNNSKVGSLVGLEISGLEDLLVTSGARSLEEYLDLKTQNMGEISVSDLHYLDSRVAEKLERAGIHTLEDLALTDAAELYFIHGRRTITRAELIHIMTVMQDYGVNLHIPRAFGEAMNFFRKKTSHK